MGIKRLFLFVSSIAVIFNAEFSLAQTALEKVTQERAELLNRGLTDGAASGLAIGANPLLDEADRETIIAAAQLNVDKLKEQFEAEKSKLVEAQQAIEDNHLTHVTYEVSKYSALFLTVPTTATGIIGFAFLMADGRQAKSTKIFGRIFAASAILQAISIAAKSMTSESVNLRKEEVDRLSKLLIEIAYYIDKEQEVIDFLINNPGVDVRQFIVQD